MPALVTGSSGFVGSNLIARLPGDSFSFTRTPSARINEIVGDLAGPLPELPEVDTVFHCAAELDDESAMEHVNVDGTRKLIEWAVRTGVRRFVFLSTGAVYGSSRTLLDEDAPLVPASTYARTKRRGEELLLRHGTTLDIKILRLFFPYGPSQSSRRLIPRLIESLRRDEPIACDSDGGPFLTPTFISDVVEWMMRVTPLEGSRILNVAGTDVLPVRHLAEILGGELGLTPRFELRSSSDRGHAGDSRRLRALTSHEPIPFIEGMRLTCGAE